MPLGSQSYTAIPWIGRDQLWIYLHSRNFTWNLKIFPLEKEKNIFQTSIFGFHVSFRVSMNWGVAKTLVHILFKNMVHWFLLKGTLFPDQKFPTVTVRQDPIYEYHLIRGLDSDTYGRLKFIWMTPCPPMNMFLPRLSMQIVGAWFGGMCIWMNFQHVRPQMCPW